MDRADAKLFAQVSAHCDGSNSEPNAEGSPGLSARKDADVAIAALGMTATRLVAPVALHHLGQWLDWPDWFMEGTSLPNNRTLPDRITAADDLIMTANLVDHGYFVPVLRKFAENMMFTGRPSSMIGLSNAPSLSDALCLYCRSLNLNNPHLDAHFSIERGAFVLAIDAVLPGGRLLDFTVTAAFMAAACHIGAFIPSADKEIVIDLMLQKTAELEEIARRIPGSVRFGSTGYRVCGNAAWLQSRNRDHDDAFWLLALERIAEAERLIDGTPIIERIRQSVDQALNTEKRVPRLKQIAAAEGVSERTMVRMLSSKETHFHAIVEEQRRLRAAELIGLQAISLSEIAAKLGFTDMSSFGRSFRQWFGTTPGRYRKRL